MMSLTYVGPRQVEWRDVPQPKLRDDRDALVRPVAASSCDLDRRIVAGRSPLIGPFALGHEAVAEVLDVGDQAGRAGVRPGQLVVVPWHLSCGGCSECAAERPGTCTTTPPTAAYGVPVGGLFGGLHDDVVHVPFADYSLVALPDGVDPWLAASCSDNIVDAYRAVAPTLEKAPGGDVLVVGGTASLGLFMVMFARALGAGQVTYCDPDPAALPLAQALGATGLVNGRPDRVDGRFALTIDASADPAGALCAARSASPGGTCVIRSVYFTDIAIPYWEMYRTGVTLEVGPPHVRPSVPAVLRLLQEGAVDPTILLGRPLPFDDAPEVLIEARHRKPVFTRPLLAEMP